MKNAAVVSGAVLVSNCEVLSLFIWFSGVSRFDQNDFSTESVKVDVLGVATSIASLTCITAAVKAAAPCAKPCAVMAHSCKVPFAAADGAFANMRSVS